MNRRLFLKGSVASVASIAALKAGLFTSTSVMAEWNEKAFRSKKVDDALNALYGSSSRGEAKGIKFKTPSIAENGLVVPIEVDASNRTDVKSIAIVVEQNPSPLACTYSFDGAAAYVKTRIKMGKTSNVLAVLETSSGLESASREIKVTIGGCGG